MSSNLRYPNLSSHHIANVQAGDEINTPMGIEAVQFCTDYSFTTYKHEDGKVIAIGHYGSVPYFEGGNEKIFSRILK